MSLHYVLQHIIIIIRLLVAVAATATGNMTSRLVLSSWVLAQFTRTLSVSKIFPGCVTSTVLGMSYGWIARPDSL
jgi:hypothetical protein